MQETIRNLVGWGFCLLFCAHCLAQNDQPLRFDAASIKPYTGDPMAMLPFTGGPGGADPGRVSWGQVTLRTLVAEAYGIHNPRDVSGPGWLDEAWYSITATYPRNTTRDQFQQMVASLLVDRFDLVAHREPKPVTGYEMTVASTGLKISSTPSADSASPPTAPSAPGRGRVDRDGFPVLGPGITFSMIMVPTEDTIRMTFRQATMGLLANRLNALISMRAGGPPAGSGPVVFIDKTGLKDKFDFHLEVLAPASDLGVSVASISKALEKQLGLQLTATKTTADLIVIDHVDRVPAPN